MTQKNLTKRSAKTPKNFRLSENSIIQLNIIKKEKNFTYETDVIEWLIDNYFIDSKESIEYTVDKITNNIEEKLSEIERNYLNPIRAASNIVDRNTNTILEFWNHTFAANPTKNFATTDKIVTPEFRTASNLSKQRISEARQKKLERIKKKDNL